MSKNISSIKARILEYIDLKEITKYEFYKKSKITRSVLDKNGGISEDNLTKFIAYEPGINLNWLIKGEGEMFMEPESMVEESSTKYKKATKALTTYSVPLYNLESSKGLSALFHRKSKPESYIRIPSLPRCDGAVFVIGDSMYPFLKSGDIVMYKEIHNISESLIWGEMYLISIDLDGEEYIAVKRIQKSERGQGYVKLVSQNQRHEAKDIAIERIIALALIKANIHINTMQ